MKCIAFLWGHPLDIIKGRKTLTRRTAGLDEVNVAPDDWNFLSFDGIDGIFEHKSSKKLATVQCPFGKVGDILFVEEIWSINSIKESKSAVIKYSGDHQLRTVQWNEWLSEHLKDVNLYAIHSPCRTPEWASRATVEITDLRLERLHDLSDKEVSEESSYLLVHKEQLQDQVVTREMYMVLWDKYYSKDGHYWHINRWMWSIGFKLVEAKT